MSQEGTTRAKRFQPTLPARGATVFLSRQQLSTWHISTHAPRTGSDRKVSNQDGLSPDFNPRSPHGERQTTVVAQSGNGDFNPRSPHGERLSEGAYVSNAALFQPTLPARGATILGEQVGGREEISTHAPRTGSDRKSSAAIIAGRAISTHAPRTGSDGVTMHEASLMLAFQPTLPARGATEALTRWGAVLK